jgi:hypothetical protein
MEIYSIWESKFPAQDAGPRRRFVATRSGGDPA